MTGGTRRQRKLKEPSHNGGLDNNGKFNMDIIPLPGFQQAFGSTEIGRFSEVFFHFVESAADTGVFESEADTFSPSPWDTGDSLEGPHIGLTPMMNQDVYADSCGSTDSPSASITSYLSDICTTE